MGEVYQRVTNHVPPESLATVDLGSARAFIELCLEPEPTLRPSARELLEHAFLKVRACVALGVDCCCCGPCDMMMMMVLTLTLDTHKKNTSIHTHTHRRTRWRTAWR